MKRILFFLLGLFLAASCSTGTGKKTVAKDDIRVVKGIAAGYFNARWMPDDRHLLVAGVENKGLHLLDLKTNAMKTLCSDKHAGNRVVISEDGQNIAYQGMELVKRRRLNAVVVIDLNGVKKRVYSGRSPCKVIREKDNVLYYLADNKLHGYHLKTGEDRENPNVVLGYEDSDLHLVAYRNGTYNIIDPLEEGKYIWASSSPDGTKIVFNRAGLGTHICDFNGKILADLGRLHAAEWSKDGQWVIGMSDLDDGMTYTESDIIKVSSKGKPKINLTKHSSVIALYPRLSNDGTQVVFNSPEGWIYLLSLSSSNPHK